MVPLPDVDALFHLNWGVGVVMMVLLPGLIREKEANPV